SCNDAVIVEITAAANWPSRERVLNRKKRGFAPTERRLLEHGIITPEWRIRFLRFVRSDNHPHISAAFAGHSDVAFYSLEDATIPRKFWETRMTKGYPEIAAGLSS